MARQLLAAVLALLVAFPAFAQKKFNDWGAGAQPFENQRRGDGRGGGGANIEGDAEHEHREVGERPAA